MIKITEKYYADKDKYNWILCEKHVINEKEAKKSKNVQAGNIEYKNISYHMTLEQLLIRPEKYLFKNEIYYIYCQSGHSSNNLVQMLNDKGYHTVNITGGYNNYLLRK